MLNSWGFAAGLKPATLNNRLEKTSANVLADGNPESKEHAPQ